jgi:hypothetical protein
VLTEKLILQMGLSPQRIVRMAISDLYEKQQAEITIDRKIKIGGMVFSD